MSIAYFKELRKNRKSPPDLDGRRTMSDLEGQGHANLAEIVGVQLTAIAPLLHRITRVAHFVIIPLCILFTFIHVMMTGPTVYTHPDFNLIQNPFGVYTDFRVQLEFLYVLTFSLTFIMLVDYLSNLATDVREAFGSHE